MKQVNKDIIYNNLVRNLSIHSTLYQAKKFTMNFNLFELFSDKVDDSFPFIPETEKEILKKRKIYGYYARLPIVIDKNLLDNFLIVNFSRNKKIIVDLEIFHIKDQYNQNINFLQNFIEHIQDFPNLELGISKRRDKDIFIYDLLHLEGDLTIGSLTLFVKDIEEYFQFKSERIIWNFTPVTVKKILKEIEIHKDHTHNIDIHPSTLIFSLTCFDCRKKYSTREIESMEILKKEIPKKYLREKNRGYKI